MSFFYCRKIVEKQRFIYYLLSKTMAKLTPVILPAKALKDGKHKVRIAIAHNSQTRYIATDIILDSEKEFKNGQIVKRADAASKNTKLRKLLQQYQNTIDEINYTEGLTCPELITFISKANNRKGQTISSIFYEYIEYANLKPKSIQTYKNDFNSLVAFMGAELPITYITHSTILKYDAWLRKKNLSNGTIRNKMTLLMTLISYSKRCLYAEFRINPFDGYTLPEQDIRDSWLSVDEIKKIKSIPIKKNNIAKCRDIFMLSYFLGGINIIDLLKIDFNKNQNSLRYIRTKTDKLSKINKYVEFEIPEEAKHLIEKYKGKDGKLHFASAKQEQSNMHTFFTYNMPKLAKIIGIDNIIYYSARKSFSQHAFKLHINTDIIDFILGHKIGNASSCLYSYIAVTPEMATEAIRKVLDNLK